MITPLLEQSKFSIFSSVAILAMVTKILSTQVLDIAVAFEGSDPNLGICNYNSFNRDPFDTIVIRNAKLKQCSVLLRI